MTPGDVLFSKHFQRWSTTCLVTSRCAPMLGDPRIQKPWGITLTGRNAPSLNIHSWWCTTWEFWGIWNTYEQRSTHLKHLMFWGWCGVWYAPLVVTILQTRNCLLRGSTQGVEDMPVPEKRRECCGCVAGRRYWPIAMMVMVCIHCLNLNQFHQCCFQSYRAGLGYPPWRAKPCAIMRHTWTIILCWWEGWRVSVASLQVIANGIFTCCSVLSCVFLRRSVDWCTSGSCACGCMCTHVPVCE